MCNSSEQVINDSIRVIDISDTVSAMPDPKGFIVPDKDAGIRPQFANEIKALYVLMHWPFLNETDPVVIDEEKGISNCGVSVYAAVLAHGKKHVAEVFLANEKDQSYRGSLKAFSIEFPENQYVEEYDEWLMDELAGRVLGVKREKVLGHSI